MKNFNHINAKSLEEAIAILSEKNTVLIAGGTDIIPLLKDTVLPEYPETVINLKTVPGLEFIKEIKGNLCIGANTRLTEIAGNRTIKEKYTALAEAASKAATPHIRQMGTIAGNICQLTRCWYFRKPQNRFQCVRKNGNKCFAAAGDSRYHSIFGAVNGCLAVNPGDLAPALIALNAEIITTKRIINAIDLWETGYPSNTVLAKNEIITEIQITEPSSGTKSTFIKFAVRKSVDFAIVNCAVSVGKDSARICLNGVAPNPYRAEKAETVIAGKKVTAELAEKAGDIAVADAKPLKDTAYKVQIAKILVKRALLSL
ncbi:MAG: FAD binding domain-containing protein [Spirochaetes bacterium]|nr:FAD binding domain-containing protein [Spirochaetota bacterium]